MLAELENDFIHCDVLLSKMVQGCEPHFCQERHQAHILHKTNHRQAVEFAVENLFDKTTKVTDYKFDIAATTKNKREVTAMWTIPQDVPSVPMQPLFDLFSELRIAPSQEHIDRFSWEYDLTVPTCQDCNTCMTMQFWYRYHLYTSKSINPARIIASNALNIKLGNKKIESYPKDEYNSKEDYFSAYIAYFLQLCYPKKLKITGMFKSMKKEMEFAKKVYLKCCWIIMQITCLVSEYMNGSENKGKFRQNPRCVLAAIELYASYMGWVLSCYQYTNAHTMGFHRWHQLYVWDLPGSYAFKSNNVNYLFDTILPKDGNLSSRDLIQQVCINVVDCYKRYMSFISSVMGHESYIDAPMKEHFFYTHDWALVETILTRVRDNFDSYVEHFGIRCMWLRVLRMSFHASRAIQLKMQKFLQVFLFVLFLFIYFFEIFCIQDMEDKEVAKIAKTQKISISQARRLYLQCLANPLQRKSARGVWACLYDWNSIMHVRRRVIV